MLVLSRKLDQDIVIGDNIRIRILKVKGNTIRLGIEAPRDVKVKRGELPSDSPTSETQAIESKMNSIESQSAFINADAENSSAEVTIVFQNNVSQPSSRRVVRSVNSSSANDVLAFRGGESRRESDFESNPSEPSGSNPAIQRYRAPLPLSLQHNRLKELVKELTREN